MGAFALRWDFNFWQGSLNPKKLWACSPDPLTDPQNPGDHLNICSRCKKQTTFSGCLFEPLNLVICLQIWGRPFFTSWRKTLIFIHEIVYSWNHLFMQMLLLQIFEQYILNQILRFCRLHVITLATKLGLRRASVHRRLKFCLCKMSHDMKFPTMWHLDMNRLRRVCAASF